jgi:hypothetical protein
MMKRDKKVKLDKTRGESEVKKEEQMSLKEIYKVRE